MEPRKREIDCHEGTGRWKNIMVKLGGILKVFYHKENSCA